MFHGIGLFFRFMYHFLFIDQKDGSLSYTKFFSIVGYSLWCWAFPYAVVHGSNATFELWMVFGAVVIGNHTLQTVMLSKSGVKIDESATWKGKMKDEESDGDDTPDLSAPVVAPPPPVPPPPTK